MAELPGLLEKIGQELRDHVRLRADVEVTALGTIADGAKRLDDRRSYE